LLSPARGWKSAQLHNDWCGFIVVVSVNRNTEQIAGAACDKSQKKHQQPTEISFRQ
jgi:hypothetical protein